jgi:RND superfamily putative drug exporter
VSRFLARLGRFSARRHWMVIGLWVAAVVAVFAAASAFGHELVDDTSVPGLDSQAAVDLLSAAGSDDAGLTAQVVVATRDGADFVESPAAVEALTAVEREVAALPRVLSTSDPAAAIGAGADTATSSGVVSPDGRVAIVRAQYPIREELGPEDLERLKDAVAVFAEDPAVQVEAGGDLFFAFEDPGTGIGEVVGLIAAVVVLLFAFGSVVAMGLPIGTALIGLGLGVGSLTIVTRIVEIPAAAPVMASMVGLGAGIDYALFVVTRHREHLAGGMPVVESIGRAVGTAGQAVVFAGGTVIVSILGLAVAGLPFLTAAAVAIALVVAVMVAASITLLPALLGLAGTRIDRLRVPTIGRHSAIPDGTTHPWWERWGAHVSRRALPYAIGTTVALAALAAPVAALRLGVPDEGTLAETRTERRAYDLVAEGFGPGANGPLLIAVDIARDTDVVDPLVAAIADDSGIAAVSAPDVDTGAGVAAIVAVPATAPQDAATRATVERLRSDVFPGVLADSPATAHVGGQTANFADMSERVQERLPLFIAAVVLLSFVLLTIVFRSLLVPLKAAILNLLSIGAAYGVLVMVFQWEWGARLIGVEAAVPIVSFIPMLMFAVVFGLSMDYEVFLLTRVREHYLATGDNDGAVVHGLAGTARVITSAALIMVSVFLAFVAGSDPTVKMLGLGLATAILVDATVVRMVLVPATMKLMGDANWWLPAWLDRLLPTIDLDGGSEPARRRSPRMPAADPGPPVLVDAAAETG